MGELGIADPTQAVEAVFLDGEIDTAEEVWCSHGMEASVEQPDCFDVVEGVEELQDAIFELEWENFHVVASLQVQDGLIPLKEVAGDKF